MRLQLLQTQNNTLTYATQTFFSDATTRYVESWTRLNCYKLVLQQLLLILLIKLAKTDGLERVRITGGTGQGLELQ
jgi:hypothetical protein